MKAWVYRRYGSPDVLTYEEIEAKVPGAKDIEIRVRASGLNAADWHIMRADPFLARIANIALSVIYALTIIAGAIGEWNYYILGSAIEVMSLAAIVYYAWTWPKEARPTSMT